MEEQVLRRPRLLTLKEVASELNVSTATVNALIAASSIPVVHVGTRLRIRPQDLDEFIARARVPSRYELLPGWTRCPRESVNVAIPRHEMSPVSLLERPTDELTDDEHRVRMLLTENYWMSDPPSDQIRAAARAHGWTPDQERRFDDRLEASLKARAHQARVAAEKDEFVELFSKLSQRDRDALRQAVPLREPVAPRTLGIAEVRKAMKELELMKGRRRSRREPRKVDPSLEGDGRD